MEAGSEENRSIASLTSFTVPPLYSSEEAAVKLGRNKVLALNQCSLHHLPPTCNDVLTMLEMSK